MSKPLVSILVRSMDRPVLAHALQSVAAQDYPDIEVVVVAANGPAHRALPERCGRFPLRFVRADAPLSRAQAANVALDAARGEWLNFLDDDDQLLPGHVTALQSMLAARPDARLAHALSIDLAADGSVLGRYGAPFEAWRQLDVGFFRTAAALFARSLVDDGARFDPAFDILEDMDFWVQCAQRTPFVHVGWPTVRYAVSSGGSGTGADANHDRARVDAALAQLRAKWSELAARLDATPQALMHRGFGRLAGGQPAEALEPLRAALAHWPDDAIAQALCGIAELHGGGDPADAERLLARAVKQFPQEASWQQHLADARARLAAAQPRAGAD